MTKTQVIKRLIKSTGMGMVDAIRVYNELSCNGFYEIERKELNAWIKKNF